jgi:hypothetical protein
MLRLLAREPDAVSIAVAWLLIPKLQERFLDTTDARHG